MDAHDAVIGSPNVETEPSVPPPTYLADLPPYATPPDRDKALSVAWLPYLFLRPTVISLTKMAMAARPLFTDILTFEERQSMRVQLGADYLRLTYRVGDTSNEVELATVNISYRDTSP